MTIRIGVWSFRNRKGHQHVQHSIEFLANKLCNIRIDLGLFSVFTNPDHYFGPFFLEWFRFKALFHPKSQPFCNLDNILFFANYNLHAIQCKQTCCPLSKYAACQTKLPIQRKSLDHWIFLRFLFLVHVINRVTVQTMFGHSGNGTEIPDFRCRNLSIFFPVGGAGPTDRTIFMYIIEI